MTDKQLEEKKKEFMKMAENGIQASLGVERYGVSIIFEDGYIDLLWQWISKLVEEVEDSLVQEFEDCISEELLIDVEKFLDLKDTVESKWD